MLIARYALDGECHYGDLDGDLLRRREGGLFGKFAASGVVDRLENVRLLAPLASPRVFAVGMNYIGHIAEAGAATPEIPLIFMKPSTSVIGPGDPIVLPREAQVVHHECELAIVIGKQARRIARPDALSAVFGYTCANDVSERIIQNREMANGALVMGKGFDSFCPLGPVIATGIDPSGLSIQAKVNGQVRQQGHTGDLLFDVAYLVSYLASAITLLPGDVILTGTPSGVGPLVDGDHCEIDIEGIGTLSNPVVSEV